MVACATLNKDGVYELSVENVDFKLELPCKDGLVDKYIEFEKAISDETGIDLSSLELGNLVIGKLTIDNKTDMYLKEGENPLKVVLNNADDKVIEGISVERLFQIIRNAAESKGKNVHITYTGGIKDYTHAFLNEKYYIKLLEREEIAMKVMQVRSDLGSLVLEALPSVIILEVELSNDGGSAIVHKVNDPAYEVVIAKKDGKRVEAKHIVKAMEEFQRKIERAMGGVSKDARKYNSLVYLYNNCAGIIKESLKDKKEIISDGNKSIDYYVAENVMKEEIAAIELKGGKFHQAGTGLMKEMLAGYEMPVKPKSKSVLYLAFPNYDEVKLRKIYLSIGQLVEEMK
jgi:hypothetical protein